MANSPPASPLRGWFGGKSRLTSTLIPLIPAHHCYAEVFAGAAWLLFHKSPSRTEALNDINADIINLYRVVQNHSPELLRLAEQMLPSRDEYQRLQATPPDSLTDVQRAVRFLYLHRLSFGGRVIEQSCASRRNRPPRFNPQKLMQELTDSRQRLQGVMLERLPYSEFIRRYDADDTFFYVDPPYWGCEGAYGKGIFSRDDFSALATQLRGIKGKFLLSINDVPQIREIFDGFHTLPVKLRYSVPSGGNQRANELLIANYPLFKNNI
ncbi:DNA adenine methylase [Conchiformibius steedae DSM 2580]|uniref:site-specific DNA-methyltransferase (adenine-specific) n=1 Tax=Conchiformibius steedae DSM 2580 TaxID=1121352 RepID=A0AAE9L0H8_9NEIS|nr:DNA adenine methylase [Conchiformibius steedae]QMT33443.1 DNA adenine methylase [Conchiformibius steedae]URD68094.1 DNA adenine methylase [Conchiformibius steedae DSM 2580]